MIDDADYFVAADANLENITHFTVTGWWKPNGEQQAFSALFSSGDWCAHCDYTEGLIFSYFGDKLWYKWPGGASWGSNSGIVVPLDEWSYVALVIEPFKVSLYLNDQVYTDNRTMSPGNITNLHIGKGHYSKYFKGEIDEVTVWNRALTQEEVRLLRHLTKEGQIPTDPNLIAYYQFNTLVNENRIQDHAGTLHGKLIGNASLTESTVPVGAGTSQMQFINGSGIFNYPDAGVSLSFPATGPYPNGEVVVSRITVGPDLSACTSCLATNYWIINNYGSNNTINLLTELSLDEEGDHPFYENGYLISLHQRDENGYGSNWEEIDNAHELIGPQGEVLFNANLNLDSFGQYDFDFSWTGVEWIGVVDTAWNNPGNWSTGSVPTSSSNVLIPEGTPHYPDVDVNVTINLLCVMQGAELQVRNGYNFEVINN